jgi:2-polyprenyl-3-methyl-5-hydroxy-6-metoxy-1,4-benzoquinol methylase
MIRNEKLKGITPHLHSAAASDFEKKDISLNFQAATFQSVPFKHPIQPRARIEREQYILDAAKGAESILHIGCSDHPFTESLLGSDGLLHSRLLGQAPHAVGFDISRTGIALLKKQYPKASFLLGDAETLGESVPENQYELIIAGEVLEHLSNPGLFLAACAKVLKKDGKLLLTVPNAFGIRRLIHVFMKVENYHPDHTFYLSENTVKVLADRYGFSISRSFYYGTPTCGSFIKKVLYALVEALPAKIFGNHFLEGLVIELKLER